MTINAARILNKPVVQATISKLGTKSSLLPVIALEGIVTTGRCYQAQQRNGWIECRERLFEELTTAAVWFFGVTGLQKAYDVLSKNVFKINTAIDFDSKAYKKLESNVKLKNKFIASKFAKVVLSSLAAIVIVGDLIPKANQALTKKEIAKRHKNNKLNNQDSVTLSTCHTGRKSFEGVHQRANQPSMKGFLESTKAKQVAFGSGIANFFKRTSFLMENNDKVKLLTVDAGITGGRTYHGRNENERLEILIKDGGAIPFYLSTTHLVFSWLSKTLDKNINAHLDPKISQFVCDELKRIHGEGKITANAIKNQVNLVNLEKANELFFKKEPFLFIKPKPQDFIHIEDSAKEELKENIETFVNRIADKVESKGKELNKEEFSKLLEKTFVKNSMARLTYALAGVAFSGFFIAYAIPKFQRWVTKQRTGKDEFPALVSIEPKNEVKKSDEQELKKAG